MKIIRLTILAMSAFAISGIGTLSATQIANSSIGLANPLYIQTFESPASAVNTLINSSFSYVSSNTLYYDGNNAGGYACAFYEENGNCVTNFTSMPTTDGSPVPVAQNVQTTFSMFFTIPQTGVAFAMVAGGQDKDTFTALKNGVQVASFTAVVGSNYHDPGLSFSRLGNFFGFSNITGGFDQIQVQTTGSNHVVIDNVQLAQLGTASPTAPEPGTLALLGLGLGGFFALRRQRAA